ncbi:MAG: GyrI-like domain-containing protein [Candidatus Brocadiae bacterium]|nr:GyrI-like domain-containing protein [Candidatus Brocadiia bacterium]
MAEIQVKEVEAMTVMSLSFTGPYDQSQEKLDELMSWLLRVGHPHSALPMGLYYDNPAEVAQDELRAEVCLPIEEKCEPAEGIERKRLPDVTVAFAVHEGPYSGIPQVYEEIFNWMGENGYRPAEDLPAREIFHKVHGQADDPAEYLTEIQISVEKA